MNVRVKHTTATSTQGVTTVSDYISVLVFKGILVMAWNAMVWRLT